MAAWQWVSSRSALAAEPVLMKGIPAITDAQIEELEKLVESHGIEVEVGR
jgi:hypothetical protein